MTDKCWFVLRHQHYPPPELPANGVGTARGPLCLGHLVPDPKQLDEVINTEGVEQYPPDMPVHKRTSYGLRCATTKEGELSFSLEADIPVAAAVGADISTSTSKLFQKSVTNSWNFDSLDTFILQVTQAYIEDSIDDETVAQYITKHKVLGIPRSMYMITGLMIARGASLDNVEDKSKGVGFGLGSQIPEVASLTGEIKHSFEKGFRMSAHRADDFIWAVRLAKISRGILDRSWNYHCLTKGATFDTQTPRSTRTEVENSLASNGLEGLEAVSVDGSDEFMVLL